VSGRHRQDRQLGQHRQRRIDRAFDAIGLLVERATTAAAAGRAAVRERGARLVNWVEARPLLQRALARAATVLTLGITAYVFLILNKRFYYNYIAYDEGFFVWGGWSITKGLAPYRDFIEFKPPLVFITHALAQFLFGFKDGGYRKFFTLFPLASVLALQLSLVARRIGRVLAMSLVLGVVILFVNPAWHDTALSDCESIGLAYFALGLGCLLWEGRYLKVTTALGGFFMACCVLSKEPFLFGVVFTWLGLFWLRGKPRPSRESVTLYARYSLLGVGILVFLLCVYMVPTGAMKAYLIMARGYSTIYSDPTRSYCVALGLPHAATRWGNLKLAWPKIETSFLNESVLGYLAPMVAAGAVFAFRRSRGLFLVMVLAAIGALWAPTATICQWVHYYTMSMAGLIFVLVAGVDSMTEALRGADRAIRWGTSLAALLVVVLHGWTDFAKQVDAKYTRPPWFDPVPGAFEFIRKNTVPSDRIFTTGPPVIYPQTNRVSAVRESNIIDEILGSYDGKTDEERLRPIYLQLVKNKPKVVLLDPENGHRKVRHMRALLIPFLNEFKYQRINEYLYLRP
jgi:hypothetical protein